jgi:hypothetical protein
MVIHEAPPASDALGSPRHMDIHGMVSLALFVVFLLFFAGLVTGVINGHAAFSLVRDAISLVGNVVGKLLG